MMRFKTYGNNFLVRDLSRSVLLCAICLISFQTSAQKNPSVHSEVDTTFIKIGEQIKFKVTVEADSTSQVIFPEGQTFSPLETVEAFKTDRQTDREADRQKERKKERKKERNYKISSR